MGRKIILYLTIYVACFFEGETALTTSAFAAHRGYLAITLVMLMALLATQSWDWFWFFMGRTKGQALLNKRPLLKEKANKIERLLMKYPNPVLFGYRFFYGFRTAVPLVIGMSSISKRKFLFFSLLNTILWDILFSSFGYFFGAVLKASWKKIEEYEFLVMICIVVLGVISGLTLKHRSLRKIDEEARLAEEVQ
jgi:membrane protein DedA with SNARE-associated domain